jgi:DNA-binding transcriptional LysR family regulator
VAADQLDLGIVSLRPSAPARSRHHELTQIVLGEVGQDDLRDTHLITFPTGYNLRTILEDWFHAAGCSPIVAAETGAIEVMLQLIATGIGVAILPRSLARRGLAMGMHCVSLEPQDSPRRVVAAVRRRTGRNAELVDVLLPILEEYARDASRPAVPLGRAGRRELED